MSEVTVMVPLGGRDIEMRRPSDGALVVLSRTFRGVRKIENVEELSDGQRDKLIGDLGTLGKVVESMIVKDEDKGWLDDAMIDGDVAAEDVFECIAEAGRKFNALGGGNVASAKAAKAVRRR